MNQQQLMRFLREETRAWVEHDVPSVATTEAKVIEVQGTLARIRGAHLDEKAWVPSLAPYRPRVGDSVLCIRVSGGFIILGAVNRDPTGTGATTTTADLAPINSPAFGGNPTAPTPKVDSYDDGLATTAHVKDVLFSSPTLGGTPTAETAPVADTSKRIATTEHVSNRIDNKLANSPTITGPSLTGNVTMTSATSVRVPDPGTNNNDALNVRYANQNLAPRANPEFSNSVTVASGTSVDLRSGTVQVKDPTNDTHAVNRAWANGQYMPKGGGVFGGHIYRTSQSSGNQFTTRSDVEGIALTQQNPTFTGTLVAGSGSSVSFSAASSVTVPTPSQNSHAASLGTVNSRISNHETSDNPHKNYLRIRAVDSVTARKVLWGSASGSSGTGSTNLVTFPESFNTYAPVVIAQIISGHTSANRPVVYITNTTQSGFRWSVFTDNSTTATFSIYWVAIGGGA